MTWLIYFTTIILGMYFLFIRSRIDIFLIAFGSTIIYFLPCFFGYDLYGFKISPVIDLTYTGIILALALAARVFDRTYGRQPCIARHGQGATFLSNISTTILLAHLLYLFVEYGPSQIFVPKRETTVSFLAIFFLRTFSTISFLSSLVIMRRSSILVSSLALVVLLLSGDRTGIVMATFGAFILFFHGQSVNLRSFTRGLAGLVFLAVIGIYGKAIYFYASKVASGTRPDFLRVMSEFTSLDRFEPFATQAIFNKIVHSGYIIDSSYLLGLPVILLPSSRIFGVSSAHFNTEFQAALFAANTPGSMAYNFWAEGYANFQTLGLLLFITLYVSVLFALQVGLNRSRSVWVYIGLLIMSPYWAFYIHRNSLFSMLAYEKQFFYLIAFFYLLYRIRKHFSSI